MLPEHFMLEDPNWKYDIVPEIMDGKNIADYIDADILQKLEELEKEEELLDASRQNLIEDEGDDIDPALLSSLKEVKKKKALFKMEHKLKQNKRSYPKNKELSDVKEKFIEKGVDPKNLEERVKNKRRGTRLSDLRKEAENMEIEEEEKQEMKDEQEEQEETIQKGLEKRKRSISRSKSKGFKIEKSEMAKVLIYII